MDRSFAVVAALAAGLAVWGVGAVSAQGDVVSERQQLMKQIGGATRTASQIAKGELPFDAAKAKEIFTTYAAAADKGPALFPAGSATGDTRAAPAIWDNNAGFVASFAALGEAAQQGLAAQDLDGFRVAFDAIGKECSACHQTFRLPR